MFNLAIPIFLIQLNLRISQLFNCSCKINFCCDVYGNDCKIAYYLQGASIYSSIKIYTRFNEFLRVTCEVKKKIAFTFAYSQRHKKIIEDTKAI